MPDDRSLPCYLALVTPRLAVALLGALPLLGCADMLGLGGLTFEDEATGGAPPSSGGSGGSTGGAGGGSGGVGPASGGSLVIGSGGDPHIPVPELGFTDEYPKTWPTGAIVTATWPGFGPDALDDNNTFWVYEPTDGAVTSHRLNLLSADRLAASSTLPDWELVYAPTLDQVAWLFGYQADTGLLDYGPAPVADEAFEAKALAGSPGWTHLFLAGDAAHPFLIAADRESRLVRIGPADPNANEPEVTSVTWDQDFTELLAFRREGVDGLLRLDSALGSVDFVPIEGGLLGEPMALAFDTLPGWSLAATYPVASDAGLVIYRADTGAVETYLSGTASDIPRTDSTLWRRDLSSIVPVNGDGTPWAVAYDAATGVTDVRCLDPLESETVVK